MDICKNFVSLTECHMVKCQKGSNGIRGIGNTGWFHLSNILKYKCDSVDLFLGFLNML